MRPCYAPLRGRPHRLVCDGAALSVISHCRRSLICCIMSAAICLAEGTGFEPAVALATPVFKTGAFGRSATPPLLRQRAQTIQLIAALPLIIMRNPPSSQTPLRRFCVNAAVRRRRHLSEMVEFAPKYEIGMLHKGKSIETSRALRQRPPIVSIFIKLSGIRYNALKPLSRRRIMARERVYRHDVICRLQLDAQRRMHTGQASVQMRPLQEKVHSRSRAAALP